jgi:phi13 family phage major tail protein
MVRYNPAEIEPKWQQYWEEKETFRTDVLGEQLDDNYVLIENANTETVNFALLFEFDGDVRKIRHVLYKCAASRPGVESKTNEEEVEVQTETLSIKATPMANGYVKAKTGDDTTDAVYQNWYSAVYLPPDESAQEPANG